MNDKDIIKLYEKGYTMKYIGNKYYKEKNKNRKPVIINGLSFFPEVEMKKSDCILYVSKTIYSYIINKNSVFSK